MKRPVVALGVLLLLGAAVLFAQAAAMSPQAKGATPAATTQQLPTVPDACVGVLQIVGSASGDPWVKIVLPARCNKGQRIAFAVRNSEMVGHKIDVGPCTLVGGKADAGCTFPSATIPAGEVKLIEGKIKDGVSEGDSYRCVITVDGKKVTHSQRGMRGDTDPDIEVTRPPTIGPGGNPQ